jgi:hypothetical protein
MEAADWQSLGFDFYCQSPPRFFDDEPYEHDLAVVDRYSPPASTCLISSSSSFNFLGP